jgi:hypothetical protein
MPSAIIAEEPESAAAMNLMIAMIRLAATAAKTAILEPLCVVTGYLPVGGGSSQSPGTNVRVITSHSSCSQYSYSWFQAALFAIIFTEMIFG